jgi:hypothetical protein
VVLRILIQALIIITALTVIAAVVAESTIGP